MTEQYLKEFERWVAGPKTRKQQLRAELEEHLRGAEVAGDTDALSRLGTPREAAETFSQGYAPPVASPWRRLAAAVTDVAAFAGAAVLVTLLVSLVFDRWVEASLLIAWLGSMIWWAVGLTLLEWRYGRTPGKKALGLRVIAESGAAPGFWQIVVRRLTLIFSGPLQLIDWAFMFFNDKHQRGLDILAKTMVVMDPVQQEAPFATAANAHS